MGNFITEIVKKKNKKKLNEPIPPYHNSK